MENEKLNLLLKIICSNAEELIEEARILFAAGRYKRALFLTFTSYEETVKASMLIADPTLMQPGNRKKLYDHRPKHYQFDLLKALGAGAADMLTQIAESIPMEDPERAHLLNELETTFRPISAAFKDFDVMRQRNSLLYIDPSYLENPVPKPQHQMQKGTGAWIEYQADQIVILKELMSEFQARTVPQD